MNAHPWDEFLGKKDLIFIRITVSTVAAIGIGLILGGVAWGLAALTY